MELWAEVYDFRVITAVKRGLPSAPLFLVLFFLMMLPFAGSSGVQQDLLPPRIKSQLMRPCERKYMIRNCLLR